MKQFNDVLPFNARTEIDYVHNTVNFSYPDNKKNTFQEKFSVVFGSFGFGILLIYTVIIFIFSLIFNLIFKIDLFVPFAIAGIFFMTLFCAYIAQNYEKFSKVYPKLNHELIKFFSHGNYFVHETSLESDVFEIPLFRNICLHYNCDGEFEEFLEKVIVSNHPFKYYKDKEKKKIIEDDTNWTAKFFFSQPPKKGNLRIEYI